jgi:hypothetical protein
MWLIGDKIKDYPYVNQIFKNIYFLYIKTCLCFLFVFCDKDKKLFTLPRFHLLMRIKFQLNPY